MLPVEQLLSNFVKLKSFLKNPFSKMYSRNESKKLFNFSIPQTGQEPQRVWFSGFDDHCEPETSIQDFAGPRFDSLVLYGIEPWRRVNHA